MSAGRLRGRSARLLVAGLLAAVLLAALPASRPASAADQVAAIPIDFGLESWDPAARLAVEQAMQLETAAGTTARGRLGAIAGTGNAPAAYAGLMALRHGGSAADAVLTAAITQATLAAGSRGGLGGTLSLLYYDAASGRVFSLNADHDTLRGETDPLAVAAAHEAGGGADGRSVLVPGFVAGVEAAHERFGLLPFAALWQPAIDYAEEGFVVGAELADLVARHREFLARRPAAREILLRPDGQPIAAGDRLRQPALAETLRRIASLGADYVYAGPWAERLVSALGSLGGTMTLDDLDGYHAWWTSPLRTTYRGHDVFAYGLPARGGLDLLAALELWEASGLEARGPSPASGDSLYWLSRILAVTSTSAPATVAAPPAADPNPEPRLDDAAAAALWRRLAAGEIPLPEVSDGSRAEATDGGDAVVAIDRWGNMAALATSLDSPPWGSGLLVDGVSLNAAGASQSTAVAATPPGERLPGPADPLIVLTHGAPALAASGAAAGRHGTSLQALINVLDAGMDPATATQTPLLATPCAGCDPWVAIGRDPESGGWLAAAPAGARGAALAQ